MALDPVIMLVVRLGVGLLFAASFWHKARDWQRFAGVMTGYRLLPQSVGPIAAWAVMALELATIPAALGWGPGLLLASGLLLTYAMAITVNIRRGNDRIDCGCLGFGASVPRLRWGMVGRNLALATACLLTALLPGAARELVWMDYISVVAAVLTAVLLYVALETAFSLPSRGAAS